MITIFYQKDIPLYVFNRHIRIRRGKRFSGNNCFLLLNPGESMIHYRIENRELESE